MKAEIIILHFFTQFFNYFTYHQNLSQTRYYFRLLLIKFIHTLSYIIIRYNQKDTRKYMLSDPNINPNLSNYRIKSFASQQYPINRTSNVFSPYRRERSLSPGARMNVNANQNNQPSYNTYNATANLNSQAFKRAIDDIHMYPAGFAQLLKNQDRNITAFKLQINKQKQRVDQDMQSFKVQINHTLEDLRLSLHAHLDRVYQTYLQKTAKFKNQIFDINRMKEQLEMELGSTSLADLQTKIKLETQNVSVNRFKNVPQRDIDTLKAALSTNNTKPNPSALKAQTNQTISNMQTGNTQLKKYYILNYIAQMQRQRLQPIDGLQKQLIILNSYQNGFYQSKQFIKVLGHLRQMINNQIRRVYDNNYLYIRDLDSIVMKEMAQRGDRDRSIRVLDGLDINNQNMYMGSAASMGNMRSNVSGLPVGMGMPVGTSMSVPMNTLPISNIPISASNAGNYGTYIPVNLSASSANIQRLNRIHGANIQGTISPSEQSLRVNSAQNINLVEEPISIQVPTSQTPLCGIYINNQIALGLKDGTIQIFSCDGHNISTLKQHKSNICTLTVIRTKIQNYLASGSDVGDCKLVLWDPVTWQAKQSYTSTHNGAITGIIDLQDDTHILSAGYDRKINIYNIEQGQHIYTAPPCESSITAMVINKTGSRIVGCGLDKALYVWKIQRDYKLKTQNIVLQRKIQNNTTICAIVVSQILPELIVIATKDSKIKLVNIQKGESYKSISFTDGGTGLTEEGGIGTPLTLAYPLEMTIIERDSKPYYPLALVWPYKDRKIYQVNTETTLVNVKNLGAGSGGLEYGYGVNPKCFYVSDSGRGALVYAINQRSNMGAGSGGSCVTVHRVQELK